MVCHPIEFGHFCLTPTPHHQSVPSFLEFLNDTIQDCHWEQYGGEDKHQSPFPLHREDFTELLLRHVNEDCHDYVHHKCKTKNKFCHSPASGSSAPSYFPTTSNLSQFTTNCSLFLPSGMKNTNFPSGRETTALAIPSSPAFSPY